MTNLIKLTDAGALFASAPVRNSTDDRRPLTISERNRLNANARRMVAPILVRDVNGTRAVDATQYPAHLRRYYGVTTVARQARKRPHRNVQGIKGGQRGNGAVADGRVHGLAPADNTRGW